MQVTSLYGGPLEFLFVVESTEDPAYHAVTRLKSDFKAYIYFSTFSFCFSEITASLLRHIFMMEAFVSIFHHVFLY